MTENDRLWHSSFKPKFTPRDGLIYSGDSDHDDDAAWSTKEVLGHVKVTSLRGVVRIFPLIFLFLHLFSDISFRASILDFD